MQINTLSILCECERIIEWDIKLLESSDERWVRTSARKTCVFDQEIAKKSERFRSIVAKAESILVGIDMYYDQYHVRPNHPLEPTRPKLDQPSPVSRRRIDASNVSRPTSASARSRLSVTLQKGTYIEERGNNSVDVV